MAPGGGNCWASVLKTFHGERIMTEENTNGDEAVEGDVPEDETQAAPELDAATQAKLDHLDHLQEMEREASSLESAMKEKNEAYKAAKSRWEEKRTALLTCVRDGPEQPDHRRPCRGWMTKKAGEKPPSRRSSVSSPPYSKMPA